MSVPILSSIFGDKPAIAPFEPIDYGTSQMKSILENLKAWPKIQELGSQFQDYMTSAYNKAIPNFSKLLDMGGQSAEEILKVAQPFLEGKIPQDVQDQIMRTGAFEALGKGGQFIHSLQARDLGRTSLDMINQGASLVNAGGSATQKWAGIASGLIMNPAGELITPAQQASLDLNQSLIEREVQQARNNVNAAPNPIAKGLSDLVAYLTASYIGHGPAGKPPDAPSYQTGVNNADTLNAGGSLTSTQNSGLFGWGPSTTTTTGPLEDVSVNPTPASGYAPGSYGSYGFGSGNGVGVVPTGTDWSQQPVNPGTPGIVPFDVAQADSATNWSGAQNWGYGAGVPPPNPFNPGPYDFSSNMGMFPQPY